MKIFDSITDALKDFGIPPGLSLAMIGLVVFWFLPEELVGSSKDFIIEYLPVWLSVILFFTFKDMWMDYIQAKQYFETEHVLVEVKLPEEITQSPLAMETALNSFFYTGEPSGIFEKYLDGKLRPQFSLEIVSFQGDVRFFIYMREKVRNIVEAALYGQYPSIELQVVPDYLPRIPYDQRKSNLFGVYYKLEKPDPYPIKTYPSFGLDKETKEEFKIDPINSILEFFGSLGKGEYGLFQMIIRSHQSEKKKPGTWFEKEDWTAEAKREADKILEKLKVNDAGIRQLTEGEKGTIEALERNTSKKPFDAGMRIMYFADLDHYNSNRNGGIPTMMRAFQDHGSNNFKPVFPSNFTYAWEDPFGFRARAAKREMSEAYRWRSFISPPFRYPHFVLSAEEVATVYHFPGRVAATPTLGRITSRKQEAPPDLPR